MIFCMIYFRLVWSPLSYSLINATIHSVIQICDVFQLLLYCDRSCDIKTQHGLTDQLVGEQKRALGIIYAHVVTLFLKLHKFELHLLIFHLHL